MRSESNRTFVNLLPRRRQYVDIVLKIKKHNVGFWQEVDDDEAGEELDRLEKSGFIYSDQIFYLKSPNTALNTQLSNHLTELNKSRIFVYFDKVLQCLGLKAGRAFKTGDTICSFGGTEITSSEARKKEENREAQCMMRFGNNQYIDATSIGNYSRMINHVCNSKLANAEFVEALVEGETIIAVIATQRISAAVSIWCSYFNASDAIPHRYKVIDNCLCPSTQHSVGLTAKETPKYIAQKRKNGLFTRDRNIHLHAARSGGQFARVVVEEIQ